MKVSLFSYLHVQAAPKTPSQSAIPNRSTETRRMMAIHLSICFSCAQYHAAAASRAPDNIFFMGIIYFTPLVSIIHRYKFSIQPTE